MATRTVESEAIVLDSFDHGESDLIVTLFTLDKGRISAIAKGAKKSRKRFVNKLELFSFLQIRYRQKDGGLAFLAEAELHTGFVDIRQTPALYGIASVIQEFLLTGIKEGEPDKKIFRLTLWALHKLNSHHQETTVLLLFLIRFFDYVGYRPVLESCIECSRKLSPHGRYRFDYYQGGILCSQCFPAYSPRTLPVSRGTIMILQSAQDMPLERLQRLRIASSSRREATTLLQYYGYQLFQRDISSWKVVRKLTGE